jgi:hypothetical protein
MPEKTGGAEWGPAAPHVLECFRERVDDKPKHPADYAEEATAFLSNPSNDDDRIGLDLATGFEFAVLFGHANAKLPYFAEEQSKNPSSVAAALWAAWEGA